MILTLLEKGWFTEAGKTAVESVYRSQFEDAVRLLSIEKASL